MSDIKYSHGLLREKFIERDLNAVDYLNRKNFGFGGPLSIEERLFFMEERLVDLCSTVMKLLEELQKEKDENQ